MRPILFIVGAVFLLALALVASQGAVQAQTTFTVTKTADTNDGLCDADCSLREAIVAANALAGTDTIAFNISGAGPHTIQPTSALPTITDPVVIDGYTQPGASANTNSPGFGLNTVLKIELDGINAGASANGLHITAGNSTVRGLVINRFVQGVSATLARNGILLQSNGDNVVTGNFIGTDTTGSIDLGNAGSGVWIHDSPSNIIGGTNPEERNLISGNGSAGVGLSSNTSTDNGVQGNLIGTDITGAIDLGNSGDGIIFNSATNNVIGGTSSGARNLISANDSNGIQIFRLQIRASKGIS